MKALHFDKALQLIDLPKPAPDPGEALIRVQMAGICNTDMEIMKGYMAFTGILGHEFVGTVEACQETRWQNCRVVAEINHGCGACEFCRTGLERHCPNRQVLGIANQNGCFSEYLCLPVSQLVEVPENLTNEQAVFTEPLAAACEILEQVHIQPMHRVAIVGDGKLAQLIARVIHLTGCDLTIIGKHPSKLSMLVPFGKITVGISDDMPKFDFVIDASGSTSGFHDALGIVKPRGVLIVKSTTHDALQLHLAKIVIDEIQVIGSRCGRFEPALRLMESGVIDPGDLISEIVPFEAWELAFSKVQASAALKVLLKM